MTRIWNTGSLTLQGPDEVDDDVDAVLEDEGDDEESSEDVGEDDE